MKQHVFLKRANSKGQLAKAVINYQQALSHYANESNWAVLPESMLSHAVGKLAMDMGEKWRLAHPELMDSYQATLEAESVIIWVGDDDQTYIAKLVLGKRKMKKFNERKAFPPEVENQEQSINNVREPDKILSESKITDPPSSRLDDAIKGIANAGPSHVGANITDREWRVLNGQTTAS